MGNQLTLGSLFDGIAGFPLAAEAEVTGNADNDNQ